MSPTPAVPPVDVVIVSFNRVELLLDCCRAVLDDATPARVVVVDNASTDGSAEAVRRRSFADEVIELPRNRGFAPAVNVGARRGSSPYLLLLNPDARPRPGALGTLVDALEDDPERGAVGPRLVGTDGSVELSTGRTLTPWNELRFRLVEALYRGGAGPLEGWVRRRYGRSRATRSLSGACILLRRDAFEEIGGMDERFFLYGEDVDLCLRLRRVGWRLWYECRAVVEHVRGASVASDPETAERHYRRSHLAFYRKHLGRTASAALRAYLLVRYLWTAARSEPRRRRTALRMARWLWRDEATASEGEGEG